MTTQTDRWISLVPAPLVPIEVLYDLAYQSGAFLTWRTRGHVVSIGRFNELINESGDASFAVVSRSDDDALVGHIGLYGQDQTSGVAHVAAFFDVRRAGVAVLAADTFRRFADHVFGVLGVRKLVLEDPGAATIQLDRVGGFSDLITPDGVRRQHLLLDGVYRDVALYAVFRDHYLDRSRSSAEGGSISGADVFQVVVAMLDDVLDAGALGLDREGITGGHRLVDDLGADSIALAEILDRLETIGPVRSKSGDLPRTVQDLVELIA